MPDAQQMTRETVIRAISTLGLDPASATEVHIFPNQVIVVSRQTTTYVVEDETPAATPAHVHEEV